MRRWINIKKMFIFFLIPLMVVNLSAFVFANDSSSENLSPGAVAADILVFRPVGLAGFIVGMIAFVAPLPVIIPFNLSHEAAKVLVMEPYRYTFERPSWGNGISWC